MMIDYLFNNNLFKNNLFNINLKKDCIKIIEIENYNPDLILRCWVSLQFNELTVAGPNTFNF